jgi:hypothetical protein
MASLFISHSSSDLDATKRVVERLAVEGFAALFLDFDPTNGIPAGRAWESELYRQLQKTDGVIFLASAASVASHWCFAEISLARSMGRPVFPLRLEAGVQLSLLSDVQWIDLVDSETAFARLWEGDPSFEMPAEGGPNERLTGDSIPRRVTPRPSTAGRS